jgi:hypothetical protein
MFSQPVAGAQLKSDLTSVGALAGTPGTGSSAPPSGIGAQSTHVAGAGVVPGQSHDPTNPFANPSQQTGRHGHDA